MKIDMKSVLLGALVGILCTSSFSIADLDEKVVEVKNAYYNTAKVFFYEDEVPLKSPMIEVIDDNKLTQLYMPVNDVLDYMNFVIDWEKSENTVHLTMKNLQSGSKHPSGAPEDMHDGSPHGIVITSAMTNKELEERLLEVIQKTGNWSYVEPYLSKLSNDAIEEVVAIYNSKHFDESEFKHAEDYYHHEDDLNPGHE